LTNKDFIMQSIYEGDSGRQEGGRMRVATALTQIAEIHGHLARTEIYRGFRSLPVAFSGVCGLAAAVAQARGWAPAGGQALVGFWVVVAVFSGLVGGFEIGVNYWRHDDVFARRRTRRVLGQFAPCLVAGFGGILGILRFDDRAIALLPGLWAVLFGLGVFAARPYLPRSVGWVGLYYLLAGIVLMGQAEPGPTFDGWSVGLTFAIGQFAAALVLYWNLERDPDDV
jgi:hypothetical protein